MITSFPKPPIQAAYVTTPPVAATIGSPVTPSMSRP